MLIYCGEYDLNISGTYTAKSYYGYLPGEDYQMMNVIFNQFTFIMFGLYALTGLLWSISLWRHYRTAIFVQKYLITSILCMGIVEYAVLYLDYSNQNLKGSSELYLFFIGVSFNALRNSLARGIVLGVSLGWGITKSGLGGSGVAISVIGIMYFIFDMGYEIALRYSIKHSISLSVMLLTSLPIVILNSLICVWILISIYAQLKKLKQERQEIKYDVMFKLAIILSASSGLCLILTFLESCIKVFSYYDSYWTISWVFISMWHILFYLTLLSIMILWRINENSKNLAYSEQLFGDDLELSYEEEEK